MRAQPGRRDQRSTWLLSELEAPQVLAEGAPLRTGGDAASSPADDPPSRSARAPQLRRPQGGAAGPGPEPSAQGTGPDVGPGSTARGLARMTQDEGGQAVRGNARALEQCRRHPSPRARPSAVTPLPSRQHSSSSDACAVLTVREAGHRPERVPGAFFVCSFPPSSELCAWYFGDVTVPGKNKH